VSTSHPLPPPDPDDPLELRWRRAHLVTGRLLAWPWPLADDATYELHHAPDGGLRVEDHHLVGATETRPLRPEPAGLPSAVTGRDGRRHLAGRSALHLDVEVADDWLGGQLAVTAVGPGGDLLAATGVQHALALDERFATEAPLGVTWSNRPETPPTECRAL
jgi:pullulanase